MAITSPAKPLVDDIKKALGTMPASAKSALQNLGRGYIYEAWVLTQFAGRDRTGTWKWEHPSGATIPWFPAGAGGTLQSAYGTSFLVDSRSGRRTVQGVTVVGLSSTHHKMDIVVIGRNTTWPYPHAVEVARAIECKHYTKSVGLDIARDAGGLSEDLGGAPVRVVTSASLTTPALQYFSGDRHRHHWGRCHLCGHPHHDPLGTHRDRRTIEVMGDDRVAPQGELLPQRW